MIRIGRCYIPRRPLYSFTRSEEWAQRLLLAKPRRRNRIASVLLATLVGALLGWAFAVFATPEEEPALIEFELVDLSGTT